MKYKDKLTMLGQESLSSGRSRRDGRRFRDILPQNTFHADAAQTLPLRELRESVLVVPDEFWNPCKGTGKPHAEKTIDRDVPAVQHYRD